MVGITLGSLPHRAHAGLGQATEEETQWHANSRRSFDQVVRGRNLIILAVSDIVLFLVANVAYGGGNQHGLRNNVSNVAWAVFLIGFFVLVLFGIASLVQVIQRRGKLHT
jgi:hypothetical protein